MYAYLKVRCFWKFFSIHILPRIPCVDLSFSGMYILKNINWIKFFQIYCLIFTYIPFRLFIYLPQTHRNDLDLNIVYWYVPCPAKNSENWNTTNSSYLTFFTLSNHAMFIFQKLYWAFMNPFSLSWAHEKH